MNLQVHLTEFFLHKIIKVVLFTKINKDASIQKLIRSVYSETQKRINATIATHNVLNPDLSDHTKGTVSVTQLVN